MDSLPLSDPGSLGITVSNVFLKRKCWECKAWSCPMVLRSYLCRKDELILSWRFWKWLVVMCGALTQLYLFPLLILTVVKESRGSVPVTLLGGLLLLVVTDGWKWNCQEPAVPSPVTAEERLSPAGPDKGHGPCSFEWQEPWPPAHLWLAFLSQCSASARRDPTLGKGGTNPDVTNGGSLRTLRLLKGLFLAVNSHGACSLHRRWRFI